MAVIRSSDDWEVRYFDTSPGYTENKAIIDEVLKAPRASPDVPGDELDTPSPVKVRKSVESHLSISPGKGNPLYRRWA